MLGGCGNWQIGTPVKTQFWFPHAFMAVLAGWRTSGWGTNFFVLPTTRTRRITWWSFGSPSSVRPYPPSHAGLVFWLQIAPFIDSCVLGYWGFRIASRRVGQLVWMRHVGSNSPSPHAIRVTCMQLLPLVEMFCRWQLQEDTSDLEALMRRFDSEDELQSHELGRALLHMVRDDGEGLPVSRSTVQHEEPHVEVADPFHVVREQLAAVGSAFRSLHQQVLLAIVCCRKIRSAGNNHFAFRWYFISVSYMQLDTTCGAPMLLHLVNANLVPLAFVPTTCHHPPHYRPFRSLRLPSEFLSRVVGFQCACALLLLFHAFLSFPTGIYRFSALQAWL
jgi:hypothetical protein